MELLFNKQKELKIITESKTLSELIQETANVYLAERRDLFLSEDSVRPGILVLVNDCDWELCGLGEYSLQEGDRIVFISTLHGG